VDERQRRVGENEALFRLVNEEVESISAAFAKTARTMEIVCECGDGDCVERIVVPLASYEQVRADPTLFIVLPGHVVPSVEDIVERLDGYDVVRKRAGAAADLAAATDPRT
jgi:hypothetical protein